MGDAVVPNPLPQLPKAESFKIPTIYIKYRGTFNFQELYKFINSWLTNLKYTVYETNHKFKPPELEVDLAAKRRVSSYLRWVINVHIHMFFKERIPKIKDGKPVELVTARLEIDLNGEVETAYSDYFGKSPWEDTVWGRKLRAWYNKIFGRDIEFKQADALYY